MFAYPVRLRIAIFNDFGKLPIFDNYFISRALQYQS